ncbi:MAG: histidinol-phosphate aminotransferase family protein [Oscillospiraceae bacterium]|jgi:histidinol-phosphate aminotransferase|nr:histidinol-phosphate aminotransferase family protein [Oscillospiraceae bacterium]
MPFFLNAKVRDLVPYEPIMGDFPVRLDANESFLRPDSVAFEEIARAVEGVAFNRYPDPTAAALTAAFAGYYGIDSTRVTAGNGSDELLSVLLTAFTQQDDKVVTFTPDFSMYGIYATLSGCEHMPLEKKNGQLDLSAAQGIRARVVLFSNPCNPTSLTIPAEEIRRFVRSTPALVVLDEAYMDFSDPANSLLHEVDEYENLIVLRTASKALGMASLRLGFAVTNERLTAVLRAVKSPYNVNAVSQAIGTALYSNRARVRAGIEQIRAERDKLVDLFNLVVRQVPGQLALIGAQANFLFVHCTKADDVVAYLKEQGIIIRQFGDFLRITVGSAEENTLLLAALQEFYGGESYA